jgi:hypothetical protein
MVLAAALAIPRPCLADDDPPRSLAMVDAGIPMILFGAIGAAVLSALIPVVLSPNTDPVPGCCNGSGVRDDNLGAFIGVTAGAAFSFATFVGGIILVYFGAQHKGHSNAVITASASGFGFRF